MKRHVSPLLRYLATVVMVTLPSPYAHWPRVVKETKGRRAAHRPDSQHLDAYLALT
jgi:hypothetical protein